MRLFTIEKLYWALIFTLSLGNIISLSPFPGIRLYAYDFPILILGSYSMLFASSLYRKFIKDIGYIVVFILVGLIGLLFSVHSFQEFLSASAYLIRLTLYLLLIIPLLFSPKVKVTNLLNVIIFSGIIFLTIGYLQYFFYPDLANLFYLGWDRHLFRFFSTFLDPNFAGAFLVILFFVNLSFALSSKGQNKWVSFVIPLLYIPAIFLTYSRSTYVMLLVSGITFFLFISKKYLLLFFVILVLGIIFLPKNYGGEGVRIFRTASIIQRSETYENAITIFLKHPIVGVGFNDYRFAAVREGILDSKNAEISHAANGVSSSYLFVLATTGLLGFSVFTVIIWKLLKKIYTFSFKSKRQKMYSKAVFAIFIGVLAHSIFDNTLFYAPIMIILVLLFGILLRMYWEKS